MDTGNLAQPATAPKKQRCGRPPRKPVLSYDEEDFMVLHHRWSLASPKARRRFLLKIANRKEVKQLFGPRVPASAGA